MIAWSSQSKVSTDGDPGFAFFPPLPAGGAEAAPFAAFDDPPADAPAPFDFGPPVRAETGAPANATDFAAFDATAQSLPKVPAGRNKHSNGGHLPTGPINPTIISSAVIVIDVSARGQFCSFFP